MRRADKGTVGLQDLEGAGVVCLPRKVLEVRGVETLARDGLVDRDQRHALLGDVVHVPKSEYSGLALGGGNEEIDVAYAGRSDGLAVNDFEGPVPAGVEGGEHILVVADVV